MTKDRVREDSGILSLALTPALSQTRRHSLAIVACGRVREREDADCLLLGGVFLQVLLDFLEGQHGVGRRQDAVVFEPLLLADPRAVGLLGREEESQPAPNPRT